MRYTSFDAAIDRPAFHDASAEGRAEIDDLPIFLLTHDRAYLLTTEKEPPEARVNHQVPFVFCHIPCQLIHGKSCIIDEDIDLAKSIEDETFQQFNITQFADIEAKHLPPSARLFYFRFHFLHLLFSPAAHDHIRPGSRQPQSHLLSNALARACDNGDSPGQIKSLQMFIHFSSLLLS